MSTRYDSSNSRTGRSTTSPTFLHRRAAVLAAAGVALLASISTSASAVRPPQYPTSIVNGIVENHARGSQHTSGAYHPASNRTFVVFSGCHGQNPCAVDPYIKYLNHNTGQWSGNLRLGDSGGPADSHYYPQIIIDNAGYLHVFNGLHANAPIQHYKSTVTAGSSQILSSSKWQQVGFGALDTHAHFNRATYPRAVKSNQGHIYLFYRQTIKGAVPRLGAEQDWFEPIFYVRSTNNGASWGNPQLLFVPATASECPSVSNCSDGDGADWFADGEEWDTMYYRGHTFDPARNGVHFLIARTEFHNLYGDKHYYAFFDFDTTLVYDAQGFSNGFFLTEDELGYSNRKYLVHDMPGAKSLFDDTGPKGVVAAGSGGVVVLLGYDLSPGADRQIMAIEWSGSTWYSPTCVVGDPLTCTFFSEWPQPEQATMFDDGTYDFYFTSSYADTSNNGVRHAWKAHHDPDHGWSSSLLAGQINNTHWYGQLCRVESPHVEAMVTFMEVEWTDWVNPLPTGKLFTWGHRNHVFAINKQGSSNSTEVHVMNGAQTFKEWYAQTGTPLQKTGTDRSWEFELGDYNGDGIQDVWGIAKNATGSGKTEVHILDGASGYQSFALHQATALHETGTDRSWEFELGDWNNDGKLDLWGVARTGTGSGKVEVHILNGANGFQSFLLQVGTYMGQNGGGTRWDYELGHYDTDNKLDLYCIDKSEGSTNRPKVHVLSGSSNFGSRILHKTLAIPAANGTSRWNYEAGDYNNDGIVDLYAIERSGSATGKTTLHVLDGIFDFQGFLLRTPTVLGGTGTNGAWEFMVLR